MNSRTILHLDMDAFFAAVEQSDHPEWQGKPVIVGADPRNGKGRGVVSTCSYEARVYGVRSAMPISKAYQLCPQAMYVYPRGSRYAEVSRQVMAAIDHYSADVEQISIDEAFLDITSTQKLFGGARALAVQLKTEVKNTTHLTASVGIAPNKFVAKIASDLQKPDGLVIVPDDGVESFLAPLDLSRLWGVGQKTLPILQQLGLRTIGDLARFPQEELAKKLGRPGLAFWHLAHGIDHREVVDDWAAKSISRETTFGQDTADDTVIRQTLLYLCDDLGYEMRKKNIKGRTVTLKIRLHDFSTFTRSRSLEETTDKTSLIWLTIEDLYNSFQRHGQAVRLLGVGMANLNPSEEQLHLFTDETYAADRVDKVMDAVRKKFGEHAITRASLLDNQHDKDWIREY
jgi:DNA polymerase IV